MFIDVVPNRGSPPAVLLREAYRDENGRPQKRTLANLSKLPAEVIETLKALLKGGALVEATAKDVSIERSLPHAGALRLRGMTAPMVLDGPMNGGAFRAYTEQLLAPPWPQAISSSWTTCR